MKQTLHILVVLLLTVSTVWAQDVSFNAKLDRKKLGINERLRIDFTMNQDGDNFSPPAFEGFTVTSGPNQSVSRQWVNGKGTFSKTYTYFLSPTKRGKFIIKQAEITVNGEVYKTTPVEVTVTAAVDKAADGSTTAAARAQENIHLVAEISKGSPYLNEAFTLVYKLYVSEQTSVSNWREIDSPKYTDFWSQSVDEKQFKVYNGEYQGEPYRYVILRKTVLYPLKSGKLNIEPLSLSITVEVPTNRRDIFGRRLTQNTNITVSAKNRTINVKPLPTAGKPDNFTGAVGDFDFQVSSNKQELEATEAFEISVEAKGNGNLKYFDLPEPTFPSTLEVYEPENADKVRTNLSGMSGTKRNKYTVVPQYKGKYPIPPISFSYFNPRTKRYETSTSDEILVEVMSGPVNETATATNGGITGPGRQQVIAADKQFEFIKSDGNLVSTKKKAFFKSTKFWLLFIGPFLCIPLALLIRKRNEAAAGDVHGNRIRKADKLARKFLSTAKKNMGNQKEFYVAMERALHNYLKAKLNIQTSEMSKDRITRLLKEKEVEKQTAIEFIGLLESCEFARYTPSSDVAMQQDYDKAVRVISTIDKQL
jgi:hypothetical protein